MHLEIDLLCHGTVRSRVQMMQHRPAVHRVLLLGYVQEQGAAYATPHNYARPTGDFLAGRRSARHQPTRNNPARPIANIFVPTGHIRGRGRGKEREGWGERPEGPTGEGGEKTRIGKPERGCMGKAEWQGRDGAEDDREGDHDGGGGARATGPRRTGEKQRRQGRAPRGWLRGECSQE